MASLRSVGVRRISALRASAPTISPSDSATRGAVRSLKAGEVQQYTNVVEQARHHALQRLVDHARAQGANAVIGVRFDSSEIVQQLSEIVAYGTGVLIAPRS